MLMVVVKYHNRAPTNKGGHDCSCPPVDVRRVLAIARKGRAVDIRATAICQRMDALCVALLHEGQRRRVGCPGQHPQQQSGCQKQYDYRFLHGQLHAILLLFPCTLVRNIYGRGAHCASVDQELRRDENLAVLGYIFSDS
jgi:hypothetical protein